MPGIRQQSRSCRSDVAQKESTKSTKCNINPKGPALERLALISGNLNALSLPSTEVKGLHTVLTRLTRSPCHELVVNKKPFSADGRHR
jgi:hypothetical protein